MSSSEATVSTNNSLKDGVKRLKKQTSKGGEKLHKKLALKRLSVKKLAGGKQAPKRRSVKKPAGDEQSQDSVVSATSTAAAMQQEVQGNQPIMADEGERRGFTDHEVPQDQGEGERRGFTDHEVPQEHVDEPLEEPVDPRFAPIVTITMDETFTNKAYNLTFPVPDNDKIWSFVESQHMPRINLSENPSAIAILKFLRQLKGFVTTKKTDALMLIYDRALVGPMEQAWAREASFDFKKIEQKILNWMWLTTSWNQTMFDLREGKRFDDSLTVHIDIFRLVAKHMGLKAEDELTKRYFAKSVGMGPMQIFDGIGHLLSFERLVAIAEQSAFLQKAPTPTEATVAITTEKPKFVKDHNERTRQLAPHVPKGGKHWQRNHKPPYRGKKPPESKYNLKNVTCQLCNGKGHTARNCPYQKPKDFKPRPTNNGHGDTSVAQINAIGDDWDGLIHCDGHNGHNVFDVVLDCGATINCVNKNPCLLCSFC